MRGAACRLQHDPPLARVAALAAGFAPLVNFTNARGLQVAAQRALFSACIRRRTMQVVERAILPADEITVILGALNALKRGDASVRLPADWPGSLGRVADVFNDVVERNERMAQELDRLSRVVGSEGKLGKRGSLGDVTGFWRDSIDAVNLLIDDLVHPTSETARVIGAVAQGDLSQTMALEVDGRPLKGQFF